jgi:hypothetical protein
MPLAVLLVFMGTLYAYKPVEPIGSFSITMIVFFFIMVWVGLTQTDLENPISEQLMILKARSAVKYYISNLLFLFIPCLLYGALAVFAPLAANAVQGFTIFTYRLNPGDMICAFLLSSLTGFAGCALGSLLHPRIIKDRKFASLLAFVAAIIGLAKKGIHMKFPAARFFTWVFPPVSDVNSLLDNTEHYDAGVVGVCLLLLIAYAAAVSTIKVVTLAWKKF